MAMLRTASLVAAYCATSDAATLSATEPNDKLAAVDKVVKMMEDLKAKILLETEEEVKAYDKFACWCKDSSTETKAAITKNKNLQETAKGEISGLEARRRELDQEIKEDQGESLDKNKEWERRRGQRAVALKTYRTQLADHDSAINALQAAVQSLKASKAASFIQVGADLRPTFAFAEAMGMMDKVPAQTLALLQGPANMEDYKFKSDNVISLLENLRDDILGEKTKLDQEEVKAVKEHDSATQNLKNEIKILETRVEDKKRERGEKISELQRQSKLYSSTTGKLEKDQDFLNEMSKTCEERKVAFDKRHETRVDEVTAFSQVIGIMQKSVKTKVSARTVRLPQQAVSVTIAREVAKDPLSMAAIEMAAESAEAASFLQTEKRVQIRHLRGEQRQVDDEAREMVENLLLSKGNELKSVALTSLAGKISGDPLAKVKTLIEELIVRLKEEDNQSANQKGWCDQNIGEAQTERNNAAKASREANNRLAKNHAAMAQAEQELAENEKERERLNQENTTASENRQTENTENTQAIQDAKDGLQALKQCLGILNTFYQDAAKFYQTDAKVEVASVSREPKHEGFEDMPDTGFEHEDYHGAQSAKTGIIAMLEVMESDFTRTIDETKKYEADAEKHHLDFLNKLEMSLDAVEASDNDLEQTNTTLNEKLFQDQAELESQTNIIVDKLKALKSLRKSCVDTGMSYEERVEKRAQEIENLKKAVCILNNHDNPDDANC